MPLLLLVLCTGLALWGVFASANSEKRARLKNAQNRADDKAQSIESELRACYLPVKVGGGGVGGGRREGGLWKGAGAGGGGCGGCKYQPKLNQVRSLGPDCTAQPAGAMATAALLTTLYRNVCTALHGPHGAE